MSTSPKLKHLPVMIILKCWGLELGITIHLSRMTAPLEITITQLCTAMPPILLAVIPDGMKPRPAAQFPDPAYKIESCDICLNTGGSFLRCSFVAYETSYPAVSQPSNIGFPTARNCCKHQRKNAVCYNPELHQLAKMCSVSRFHYKRGRTLDFHSRGSQKYPQKERRGNSPNEPGTSRAMLYWHRA